MGIPLGWLLWKSLAFPQWRPVFSFGKFKGKRRVVIDCPCEGSPQTLLEMTASVARQGLRIRISSLPSLQKCVGQFSIDQVTKHLRGKKISKEGTIFFPLTCVHLFGPETRP